MRSDESFRPCQPHLPVVCYEQERGRESSEGDTQYGHSWWISWCILCRRCLCTLSWCTRQGREVCGCILGRYRQSFGQDLPEVRIRCQYLLLRHSLQGKDQVLCILGAGRQVYVLLQIWWLRFRGRGGRVSISASDCSSSCFLWRIRGRLLLSASRCPGRAQSDGRWESQT